MSLPSDGEFPASSAATNNQGNANVDLNAAIAARRRPISKNLKLFDYLSIRTRRAPYYRENVAKNHSPFLYRMNLMKKLPVHDGCVNTICWNNTGEYILSGSDDCNLCITKPNYLFDTSEDYTVLHKVQTHHLGNIFSAKFMPNSFDYQFVSCSSEGPVIVHDINATDPSEGLFNFNCHSSTIFEVVTLEEESKIFFSCGEDKTVRLFDLRCHKSCSRASTCPHPALIRNSHAMTTLSINPRNSNLLLVGRADGLGLVYDRRKLPNPSNFSREKAHAEYLTRVSSSSSSSSSQQSSTFKYLHPLDGVVSQFCVPDLEEKLRFTSLCYSANGDQVLASYTQDYIYLFDHDKSSNFELIQTLPRKNPTETTNSDNNNNNNHRNESERAKNQNQRGVKLRATPRIRVRGDWSDTGINSVPYSARSEAGNSSSQRVANIFQRMTEVAYSLSNRRVGGTRFVPVTELVAGPMEYNAATESESSNENEDQEDNAYEENGQESSDEFEITDEDLIIEAVGDDDNRGEVDEGEDDEMEGEDDSTHSPIHNADGAPNGLGDGEGNRIQENIEESTTNCREKTKKSRGRPEVSQKTKLKFKNTFAELKNKINKIPVHHPHVRYQGHRNSRTFFKEAKFWGDKYIMSGSDCGRIMIWEKETAKLVMGFPADDKVVNCLAPNPHHYVLASSGIDYDIKLWSTQSIEDCPLKLSPEEMDEIIKKNEIMLEEAKQTIIVPPHLFFRVLASFAQNRLG